MDSSKRFLVTGGAGFIGSNIVSQLLKYNYYVRVIDNFSTGSRENISQFMGNKNFELIEGDIRSYHVVRSAVRGIDYVLHQAALPSVPRSIADPITTNEVNITGTLNLLDAAREEKVSRIVCASSSSVYGDSETQPKHEKLPINPLSPYALSKYSAERYCQIYYSVYGLNTIVLRYFNVFGPNQNPDSQYSAVIPKFIKLINNGEHITIYGDGNQSRDFTYVENIVNANILACKSNMGIGEVFNIGCGEKYSINQLINTIEGLLNKKAKIINESPRPGDVKHSIADITKAQKILNYSPQIRLFEGVKYAVNSIIR